MKSTVSTLSKVIPLAFLALSLSACDKVDAENDAVQSSGVKDSNPLSPDNQHYPTTAMTWDEWVAYDSPNRNGFDRFYGTGKGSPNISQWRPEDVLPAERFGHKRRNVCELREYTRRSLRKTSPHTDTYELLSLAKQGYAEAQATMGKFCSGDKHIRQYIIANGKRETLAQDKKPVSVSDALYWAERGAASGNALAQWSLAQCMYEIFLFQDNHPDEVTDPIELDPFWFDKMFFWHNQALQNGLPGRAVTRRSISSWFAAPSDVRRQVENYKWSRLWEIQANFRRLIQSGYDEESFDIRSATQLIGQYSDAVIAQAEKEVGEWLRAYPDVWHNIYDNTYLGTDRSAIDTMRLCPGEPGYDEIFDFAWLKNELTQYDINITLPENFVTDTPQLKEKDHCSE